MEDMRRLNNMGAISDDWMEDMEKEFKQADSQEKQLEFLQRKADIFPAKKPREIVAINKVLIKTRKRECGSYRSRLVNYSVHNTE